MVSYLERFRIPRHSFLRKGLLAAAVLILIEIGLNVPTAYAQPGFLSIDCGTAQASYSDSNSLQWVTDNGTYVNTGKTMEQPSANVNQALQSFRYFPEGRSKYCYELPSPNTGFPHLVRASFYMTGSLLKTTQFLSFQFILSIDATNWFTVLSSAGENPSSLLVVQEAIFHPSDPVTNVCLQPVVGIPFISSLELRVLNDSSTYSFDGSNSQYLALVFRYNLGANASTSNVRYPDDIYDRIWTTPDKSWNDLCPSVSVLEATDTSIAGPSYYVPPKVMKDAWLFQNNGNNGGCPIADFPLYVNGPVYLTPAVYFFVAAYIEHLNTSDSNSYTEFLFPDVDVNPFDVVASNDFSQKATLITYKYQTLSRNNISFEPQMGTGMPYLDDGPTINALELYGQYNYNFSTTNSTEVEVIGALKTGFALTDWQGDPCTPVPHDWLSCNLSQPIFGNLQQPCNGSSATACSRSQMDFRTKYYVTSINLSNRTSSGFRGILGNASALPPKGTVLQSLNEMSITNSGVDNATFLFLISSVSSVQLSTLDLSYNAIDSIPPASDWAGLDNLTSLNLSHNLLAGVLSSFDDVPFLNTLQNLNLSYNAITSFPTIWTNTTESLVMLDLSHNQLEGEISSLDKWLQINDGSLQELYISNNRLNGTFSSDLYFQGLPNLLSANFDQNSISGILNLTAWLVALQTANTAFSTNSSTPNVTRQLFSLINNNISDIVPNAENFDSSIRSLLNNTQGRFKEYGILLGGNPYCQSLNSLIHEYLCRSSPSISIKDPKKNNNKKLILIISICSGVIGLLFFSVMFTILWKLWKQVHTLRAIQKELASRKVQPPLYHYSDLKLATRDFHKDNKLGLGGFGAVYKGVLADKTQLGVKVLFNSHRLQVLDEFLNEVVLITGIKHRNLVQLKGCCITDKQRILVYEYAERGNLAEALWGSKCHGGLNWEQRFNICVGVARGLSYLHEELQPSIIHRDIKPENILLDNNFAPKIADFGLARHVLDETSHARSTKIAGTIGYFAPEYVMQGQLSEKVDVYSYGILILEVLSGRKCIDRSRPNEEQLLTQWVDTMRKKNLLFDVLQPELRKNCVMAEVLRAIHIGLLCVQHLPEKRPTMSQVVIMFVGSVDIKVLPDDIDSLHTDFSKLLATIDRGTEYPTLETIEEDSSVFPLLDLQSQSSLNNTSRGSSSKPLIQLSTFYGR